MTKLEQSIVRCACDFVPWMAEFSAANSEGYRGKSIPDQEKQVKRFEEAKLNYEHCKRQLFALVARYLREQADEEAKE